MTRTLMLATAIVTVLSPAAHALVMFSTPKSQPNIAATAKAPLVTPAPNAYLPAVQKALPPRALTGGMPGPGPRQVSPLATEPMPDIPGPRQGGSVSPSINR